MFKLLTLDSKLLLPCGVNAPVQDLRKSMTGRSLTVSVMIVSISMSFSSMPSPALR